MKYLALGQRIRLLRERAEISVEELAARTGFSVQRLQNIEANQEQPMIATLITLSKALGVNVADIFRERPQKLPFEIIRKSERQKVKPLLQPREETKIFDYTYEILTMPGEDKHLDAYVIELPPNSGRRPMKDVTHPGEEFIYMLEGEMEGEIGKEHFRLKEGDSLFLRSTSPHIFYNRTDKPARALAVIYPF